MKNIKYYKQQKRIKTASNRFGQAQLTLADAVQTIGDRVWERSSIRRDILELDLTIQHDSFPSPMERNALSYWRKQLHTRIATLQQ